MNKLLKLLVALKSSNISSKFCLAFKYEQMMEKHAIETIQNGGVNQDGESL
jgi:hypothetical protein